MNAKQLFYVLSASLALLMVGLIGAAYGADLLLSKQATKLSKLRADSEVITKQQTTLAKNKQDIVKYSSLNKVAQSIVPQDKDQAQAIREITNLARDSGIRKLSSITFPASTLGTVTPGAGTNPSLTQLTVAPGIKGVYILPLTVSQDQTDKVPYSQFLTFLSKLEQNRRTAQVSAISVTPDGNNVSFSLTINGYIKP